MNLVKCFANLLLAIIMVSNLSVKKSQFAILLSITEKML